MTNFQPSEHALVFLHDLQSVNGEDTMREFELIPGSIMDKIIITVGGTKNNFAFIDKKNGDIFRGVGWRSPIPENANVVSIPAQKKFNEVFGN